MLNLADRPAERWVLHYRETNDDLIRANSEFARWLDEEYIPIAGGWMY